jgi:Ca-activated chloride channel homolog
VGFQFDHPWWLLALVPAGLAVWWWYRDERRLQGARKRTEAVLRSLCFLLLILALAGTSWRMPVDRQETLFVVDESKSITSPKAAAEWIRQAVEQKRPGDAFAVVGTGEKPAVEYPLLTDGAVDISLGNVPNQNFTNLAGGLRLAQGLTDSGYKPRVVLLSDGEQNIGDAVAEAAAMQKRGVRVDVAPLKQEPGPEVLVRSASVPSTLYEGETFHLNTVLESTVATAAELRVYEENRPVATTQVQVSKGETRLSLPLKAEQPGFHRYRVEIQPAQDTVANNNTAYAYGDVSGRPKVLIVEGKPGEAAWLTNALTASGLAYETKLATTMPSELEDLRRYAVIVLADASGTDVPAKAQDAIEVAVRDFGVGLLMTGGPDSFGLGGYFDTPVEKALPVYMDIRNKQQLPSLGLLLVIDHSGSMGGQKMEVAKEAARRATAMLKEQDTLGVLAFDDSPWWVVPPEHVTDAKKVQTQISGIHADGGTSIYPALEEAFAKMDDVEAKRKHIILLTDGQSPEGDYDGLTARMRDKGVTMTTVAVGSDADQGLLQRLAEAAKGRFYAATDAGNVPQIFTKETALAGKTFIRDQPFTPQIGRAGDLQALFAGGLPPIHAMIATTAKETADVVLAHPEGEPLLARWQYGLGRAAAWTSDAKGSWANQWASWQGSAAFWNQLMTWLLPQYPKSGLNLQAAVSAGTGQLDVQLGEGVAAGAVVKADVIAADLTHQEVSLHLQAPGRYGGTFDADRPGTYLVAVRQEQGGRVLATATAGVSVSYSPEYALPKGGAALLEAVARAGGGEVLTDPAAAYADNLPARWARHDLSWWLLLLVACIWPFDIALRRVVLTIPARLRRWMGKVAGWRPRRGGEAVATAGGSLEEKGERWQSLKKKANQAASARVAPVPQKPPVAIEPMKETSAPKKAAEEKTAPSTQDSTVARLLDKKRKK